MEGTLGWVLFIAALFGGLSAGYVLGRLAWVRSRRGHVDAVSQRLTQLLDEADTRVESARRQVVQQVQRELDQQRAAFEAESEEVRRGLSRQRQKYEKRQERQDRRTQRLNEKEGLLLQAGELIEGLQSQTERYHREASLALDKADRFAREVERRQGELQEQAAVVESLKTRLDAKQRRLDQLVDTHTQRLEEVSQLSREEAKKRLSEQMLDEAKLESAAQIKDIRDAARLTANREARKVVLTAIQRTAATQTVENTVAVVNLESDEMKGRIIGREGRNIRAFEAATGTEVIVDDTPEAVIISGFDPVRRAIARLSLIRLIQDGRIHPARIEEIVAKVTEEINEEIVETGERTVIDLGLGGVHPELTRLIGRMRYRSSYGQNLLGHSIEVAKLASLMAAELNLDARKARRAGLLHDIGKVVEGDLESPHAIVGMELCRKYKEDPEVCNGVGAHHDEVEMTTPLAPLVQSADAISGARPGARREALEGYIKRLEQLEELASAFDGVERVYAIQAGRELRVIVNHQLVSDALAQQLAEDISKNIEREMQYPGQILVTVIREVRSVAYAK
jgi:ribonucrease Y